jgi:hypothetical protein
VARQPCRMLGQWRLLSFGVAYISVPVGRLATREARFLPKRIEKISEPMISP